MARLTKWLRRNIDAVLALSISIVVGALSLAGILGTAHVDAAILLVLALLAATLLGDRQSASRALNSVSAVRVLSGLEVSQVHAEARRATEQWIFKGGTATTHSSTPRSRPARTVLENLGPLTGRARSRSPRSWPYAGIASAASLFSRSSWGCPGP